MSKPPSELEKGDVFIKKIGFTNEVVYCTLHEGNVIGFSKYSWLADTIWTTTEEKLEAETQYLYLGKRRNWLMEKLSLGGVLFPRFTQ